MKIRDYIFLAFKNITRRKKGIVSNVILIAISVIISTLVLSFSISFGNYMNRALVNNIAYRSIVVLGVSEDRQEEVIEDLESIEHVLRVVLETEERTMTTIYINNLDEFSDLNTISFRGVDSNTQPEVILGRKIKDGEKNVCIVPNKIYQQQPVKDEEYDKDDYIHGEDLLGKTINISYYSYNESTGERVRNKTFEEEYEIIGVYDVDEYVLLDSWYIPFEDVSRINSNVEENTISNLDPNVVYSRPDEQIIAIVDNALNLDSTLKTVEERGYACIVRSTANTYIVVIINVVVGIVLAVLLSIVLSSITTSSIKTINDRKYELGMLKAIGYKGKTIRNMLLFENLIIGAAAYMIGMIISIITMLIVKVNIFDKSVDLSKLNCNLNLWVCIIALLFSFMIPSIATYLSGKSILKKTPISLNKER